MICRKDILAVIEPASGVHMRRSSKIYDAIMLSAIAMAIVPLMFKDQPPLLVALDIISCVVFIVDYILRWITADLRRGSKSKKWLILYPLTPMAIIDLLSILPTLSLLNPALKLFRLYRILKLLRILNFFRYFAPLQILIAVVKRERQVLLTVLSFAVSYIFVTALVMFNGEIALKPNTGEPVFSDFFEAVYWATCTLTTVGYGDIYPISGLGRIISMVSALVGVAIIALPSGVITAGYLEELKHRHEKKANNISD